jgi:tripartite-type tricarboxylate transporter receptor subunit TctC
MAMAVPLAVCAQYPAKPVRIIVPFPGGSATDTVTRILASYVTQSLGQP